MSAALDIAAARLDLARLRFDEAVKNTSDTDEAWERFGKAEDDFVSARQEYESALYAITGQKPDDIWRRLS